MISAAVRRLAASLGLKVDEERTRALNPPQKRTAVLRPRDAQLAIRRLAEWEALMDKALDGPSLDRGRKDADQLWLSLKKEQPWTFLGWLGPDGKVIVDDAGATVGTAAPGDLHEPESRLGGWR